MAQRRDLCNADTQFGFTPLVWRMHLSEVWPEGSSIMCMSPGRRCFPSRVFRLDRLIHVAYTCNIIASECCILANALVKLPIHSQSQPTRAYNNMQQHDLQPQTQLARCST